MRNAHYWVGLALVGTAAACGGSDKNQTAKAPSDVTSTEGTSSAPIGQSTYPSTTGMSSQSPASAMNSTSGQPMLSSHDLVAGTFACLLSQSNGAATSVNSTMERSTESDTAGLRAYGGAATDRTALAGAGAASPGSQVTTGATGSTYGNGNGSNGGNNGTAGSSTTPGSTYGSSTQPGASGTMTEGSTGATGVGIANNDMSSTGRCAATAQAAGVASTALSRGDSSATNEVRRLVQSRLSSEQTSTDVSDNTLALFDKGVAALNESKMAHQALGERAKSTSDTSKADTSSNAQSGTSTKSTTNKTNKSNKSHTGSTATNDSMDSSSAPTDPIRDHKALGELYQFGQNLGMTPSGAEAQALAWVIGIDRFIGVRDLPAKDKPLAAAPLFTAILNVPAPAPTAGRTLPTWNQYLSAAARAVSSQSTSGTRGVGGGPAPSADEKSNLREISRAAQDKLQLVAQHLPSSSELRDEVNESLTELKTFAGSATPSANSSATDRGSMGTSTRGTTSGSTSGTSTSGSTTGGSSTSGGTSGSTSSTRPQQGSTSGTSSGSSGSTGSQGSMSGSSSGSTGSQGSTSGSSSGSGAGK
jgi:hypothetical protein